MFNVQYIGTFYYYALYFFTENFDNDINLTERVNYAIGHPEAEENQISDYSNNIKEVDYIKR